MATTSADPTIPGWGVDKSITDLDNNIITDWETAEEGQFAYCQDNKGAVVHREHYDTKTTITATVLFKTTEGNAAITIDKEVSIDTQKFKVASSRLIQSNKDFQKMTLTLERYTNWPANA